MMSNEQENKETWACVDLMGHVQTAGRIEMGALLRVDVPNPDGSYRTEFYGMAAIYSIKIVSEEIARAYVPRVVDVVAYDAPVISREAHQAVVDGLMRKLRQLGVPADDQDGENDEEEPPF